MAFATTRCMGVSQRFWAYRRRTATVAGVRVRKEWIHSGENVFSRFTLDVALSKGGWI
jgi:hypothetical protein